jgi:hypothetical protein
MEEKRKAALEVSFGGVLLRAPETDEYLAVAAQILEMRRRELASEAPPVSSAASLAAVDAPGATAPVVTPPVGVVTPVGDDAPPVGVVTPPVRDDTPSAVASDLAATPSASTAPSVRRRPRWFRDQFPQVTAGDGEVRVLGSLEELRDLLTSRGLQPHPRGDASMLLWQVRNRLGFTVEAVTQGA